MPLGLERQSRRLVPPISGLYRPEAVWAGDKGLVSGLSMCGSRVVICVEVWRLTAGVRRVARTALAAVIAFNARPSAIAARQPCRRPKAAGGTGLGRRRAERARVADSVLHKSHNSLSVLFVSGSGNSFP